LKSSGPRNRLEGVQGRAVEQVSGTISYQQMLDIEVPEIDLEVIRHADSLHPAEVPYRWAALHPTD